ncbi:MAG: hypothetical protein ACFFC6_17045 [Promethearchaeota archaeon]
MTKVIKTGGLTSNLMYEFLGMGIIAVALIALTIIIFDNPFFQKREFTLLIYDSKTPSFPRGFF